MGAPLQAPASPAAPEAERSRPRAPRRRLPHRLLLAAAAVVTMAAGLLVLAATSTGHTELRLSAGLHLSIGRRHEQRAQQQQQQQQQEEQQASEDASLAAAGTEQGNSSDVQQQQQAAAAAAAQPPLPSGAEPAVGGDSLQDGMPPLSPAEEFDPDEGYEAYENAEADEDASSAASPGGLPAAGGLAAGALPSGSGLAGGSTAALGGQGAPGKPAGGMPVLTQAAAKARDSGRACSEALYVKKVAILFLTVRRLAHEKLWRLWMWDAAGLVPQQALALAQDAICGPGQSGEAAWQRVRAACVGTVEAMAATGGTAAATLLPPQLLFSIYVHVQPGYKGLEYQPLFLGQTIKLRLRTWWGTAAITDAERGLLQEALKDPMNERFVLVSDSDVPLFDPLTFYQQLMWEDRSRVRACRAGTMNIDRWKDRMATGRLKRHHWRKSGQFFSLTRRHAELVMADTEVYRAFKERCSGTCVPDEHYIPTLLAMLGLENETYCGGYGIAAADWSQGGSHPRSFKPKEVTSKLLKQLRGSCWDARTAGADAQHMYLPVSRLLAAQAPQEACQAMQAALGGPAAAPAAPDPQVSLPGDNAGGSSNSSSKGTAAATAYSHPLSGSCPLTARKFPPYTALHVRQLFLTSCPAGAQVTSKAAQVFKVARDPDLVLLKGAACTAAVQRMTMQQQLATGRRKRRRRRAD